MARDQREIIDDVYGFRALGAVIHTHRPSDEGSLGPAVDQRGLVDLFRGEPSELRYVVGRVLAYRLFKLVEACGVRGDVLAINKVVLNEQMNHAVEKSDVRARL